MAITLFTAFTLGSKSKSSNTRLHPGLNERHNNHNSSRKRGNQPKSLWRRIKQLDWYQRNPFRGYNGIRHNIQRNNRWGGLSTRDSNQTSRRNDWFSPVRNNRHRQRHNHQCYYYILIYLLAIGLPVRAEGDEINNTAAPASTATGNVTNQAVQFQNNGAPSRQQMGGGIVCNGPTMTFSPFWLASENKPYDPESYSRGWNYGGQLNFMVPLDGSITERCKSIAKRQEEKMRVAYELSRMVRCTELMKKGFTIREGSRFEHLCNDVVPIVLQPITLKNNDNATN